MEVINAIGRRKSSQDHDQQERLGSIFPLCYSAVRG